MTLLDHRGAVAFANSAGFVGGWVQGTEKGAELERSLSSRYGQVVDPDHGSRR